MNVNPGFNPPEHLAESLFDEYLSCLLRNDACDPDVFLNGREVDAALRAELHNLHGMLNTHRSTREHGLPYRTLGEFRLLRQIGSGGMGVVFVAEQQPLRRIVALKILRADLAHSDSASARFEREARCVARLRHPHIVSVHTVGEDRGVRYIAMELVPGRGLDEYLSDSVQQGQTPQVSTVLSWIAQVADALDSAHDQGVLHRDIKPSNIRITPDGQAKLLDFGLARDLHSQSMTLTETLAGSPLYVAPEQVACKGGDIDARTDVYSLGITLYECLTGRVPFRGDHLEQILHDILITPPPAPRSLNADLSPEVEAVVLKAIDKKPEHRYATIRDFRDDLRALLAFRPTAAQHQGTLAQFIRLVRRKPALAWTTLITLGCITALAIAGPLLASRVQRHRLADSLLTTAQERIASYDRLFKDTRDLEAELDRLSKLNTSGYLDPDDEELLYSGQDRLQSVEDERGRVRHATLDLLRQAEELGGDIAKIQQLRAELYYVRYLEARNTNQYDDAGLFRDMVLANDRAGRLTALITGGSKLCFTTVPAEAYAYLFKIREMNQVQAATDHRLVPVPVRDCNKMLTSGTWCLLLEEDHGTLRAGQLITGVESRKIQNQVVAAQDSGAVRRGNRILSIDGVAVKRIDDVRLLDRAQSRKRYVFERDGRPFELIGHSLADLNIEVCDLRALATHGNVNVQRWEHGDLVDGYVLPPGAKIRTTSLPRCTCEQSCIGRTPVADVEIEEGHYLLVVRAEGYEEFAVVFETSDYGETRLPSIQLNPLGTTPAGYCHIPYNYIAEAGQPFWMKRHEVTVGEYLEFLNDTATLAAVATEAALMLFPRSNDNTSAGGYWPRTSDGAYALPVGWSPNQPMRGISYYDAEAYAAWMTQRAREVGQPFHFSIPTMNHWVAASGTGAISKWVYGYRFRPKWQSSCFSTPEPHVEDIMSYPIDESLYGPYDMAGSVSEWLDDWWLPGKRRHAGGSWANGGDGDMFSIWGGNGLPPEATSQMVGFRLVLTIGDTSAGHLARQDRP